MAHAQEQLPVTLLAGFLGSGKTTLLNRILTTEGGPKCAVLVNEFGDVGIDSKLIVAAEDDLVELQNGCVCCTVRGDLQEALAQMLSRRGSILGRAKFDRIVIEASGLASPGPIAQTLEVDGKLAERLFLDGVITLVHAAKIQEQLVGFPEAHSQVGYADLLVINHLDCLEDGQIDAVRGALRDVNGAAPLLETTRADVALTELFSLERLDLLGAASSDHSHATGVATLALKSDAPMDIHKLKMWLRFLANRSGTEILRMKGVLRCLDQPAPVVVQAVYQWLEVGPGEGTAPAESNLVLIGQGFDADELRRGWAACISD
ncbi:MAG: G3E family GTPase [Bacteroidia bacterium]